jgi:hypothetical protein
MSQFYISNDSEADVQRCNESRDTRLPITITGLTRDGFVKEFRGVVQSVGTLSGARRRHPLPRDHQRFVMNPRRPAGPPMTLGNMRGLGEGAFRDEDDRDSTCRV